MSKHTARIRTNDGHFFVVIVRIDRDGEESVVMARHYANRATADRGAAKMLAQVSA